MLSHVVVRSDHATVMTSIDAMGDQDSFGIPLPIPTTEHILMNDVARECPTSTWTMTDHRTAIIILRIGTTTTIAKIDIGINAIERAADRHRVDMIGVDTDEEDRDS